MPRTLIKSRLHSNKHKTNLNKNLIKLNEIYLKIYNHSNKNYYQETSSLNINSFLLYK